MFGVGCENGRIWKHFGSVEPAYTYFDRRYVSWTQPGTPALGGLLVGRMRALIAGGTCEPSLIESGTLTGWKSNVAW